MPVFEMFGNATPQVSQTRFDTSGFSSGADAIGQLSKIGLDVAIQVRENKNKIKAATLTTQAAQELEDYVFNIKKTDRDYDTQYDRFTAFAKDLSSRYKSQFSEQEATGFQSFKSDIGNFIYKKATEVRSHSINGQIDIQKGELNLNMANIAKLSARGDEEQKQALVGKANGLIKDAYQSGVITYEEAANVHLKFKDDVNSSQIRYDILTNPDLAAEKLLKGEYDVSDERSLTWLEKANSAIEANQRARFSEQDRTRRERERLEKLASENMAKSGDKLLFAGDLTEDWIEANRETLTESDYRYFYKALQTGDTGRTDPNIYSSLRFRASEGEDVRDEARSYLHRGMLKLPDYEKLISRSEKNTTASEIPSWFKRGEKFIAGSLRVSDINPDPAAAQRQSSALDAWSEWATKNPDATPDQARSEFQSIVKDYSLTDQSDALLLKPLPRFAIGTRAGFDVQEARARTVKAFRNGEISEDEAKKQALLIEDWEKGLQKQQEAENARAERRNNSR